jgi:hypothetical protein
VSGRFTEDAGINGKKYQLIQTYLASYRRPEAVPLANFKSFQLFKLSYL